MGLCLPPARRPAAHPGAARRPAGAAHPPSAPAAATGRPSTLGAERQGRGDRCRRCGWPPHSNNVRRTDAWCCRTPGPNARPSKQLADGHVTPCRSVGKPDSQGCRGTSRARTSIAHEASPITVCLGLSYLLAATSCTTAPDVPPVGTGQLIAGGRGEARQAGSSTTAIATCLDADRGPACARSACATAAT